MTLDARRWTGKLRDIGCLWERFSPSMEHDRGKHVAASFVIDD
jgi:hypothetical protein